MRDESQKKFRFFPETLNLSARALIVAVVLSGCFALLWSGWTLAATFDDRSLVLITLTSLASWFAIRIPIRAREFQSLSITLSDIFIFVAIFGERPELAVVIASLEALISSHRVRVRHPHKWIFNGGLLSSAALLSGWSFLYLAGGSSSIGILLPAALASVIVYFGLNSLLISAVISLSLDQRIWTVWSKHFLWAAPSSVANGISALCLVLVLSSIHGLLELAMLPILLVIFSAHRIHERFRTRAIETE